MDYNLPKRGQRSSLLIIIVAGILFWSSIFFFYAALNILQQDKGQTLGELKVQAVGNVYNKKVYVLIYNPVFENGQKLTEYLNWNNPDTQAAQYADWLKVTTGNKVNYTVAMRNEINDFTTFTDGSKYNEATYLACLSNNANCLRDAYGGWLMMDYPVTINSLGICNYFNSGAIDELWMFGAPYMGWWEANQAGSNAFSTNGPVVTGTSCNKPMNIMGFSYERGLSEMVEDLMHRIEGTMSKAYGSWQQNRMLHNWDKYGLVDHQSPAYSFSGCGSCHFAPNSNADYQWDSSATAYTYCDEFFDYPDPVDTTNTKAVTCSAWGCNGLGYFRWWLQRFPSKSGVAPDEHYADWWKYVLEPVSVYDVLNYVPPTTVVPTTTIPTATPIQTSSAITPTPVRVSVSTTITPTAIEPSITVTMSITPSPLENTQSWEIVDMLEPVMDLIQTGTDNSQEIVPQAEAAVETQKRVVIYLSLFGVISISSAALIMVLLKHFRPMSF